MKTHQFKTNQLGVTYNEYGKNLLYQLNLAKQKLHGQNTSAPTTKERRKYRTNQTTNR